MPDKNYVEGTEDNPQNEATQPTPIIPVTVAQKIHDGRVGHGEGARCRRVGREGHLEEIVQFGVYYLDPSNLDGALDALASDAASNTHEVTVRYVPDKNYVEPRWSSRGRSPPRRP